MVLILDIQHLVYIESTVLDHLVNNLPPVWANASGQKKLPGETETLQQRIRRNREVPLRRSAPK